MGIAQMAMKPHIQKKAYEEIQKVYPGGDSWERCVQEEKLPYMAALCKEILRFYTALPICLPRVSVKDVEWQGTIIPAGTTFYMNAYAADYDETHFKNPYEFAPERYLEDAAGTPHYSFGAGSRMCLGSHLGSRELFVAMVRLIAAFEILPPKDPRDIPLLGCLESNSKPSGLVAEVKHFKVGFKPRNRPQLERWLRESEDKTRDLM